MTHDSHTHAHTEHHEDHDHGGIGKYLVVFAVLCFLTGASFFTYSSSWPFQDTPSVGWAFMMAISCTKAMLVILFFMHLLWETSWKYVLTVPAALMSTFLVIMLVPDVGCRTTRYSQQRWQYAANPMLETHHATGSVDSHGEGGNDTDEHDAAGH